MIVFLLRFQVFSSAESFDADELDEPLQIEPIKVERLRRKKDEVTVDQLTINFINSFKGSLQLCANNFPFTRHRVLGSTVYWRCVQFKTLGWVWNLWSFKWWFEFVCLQNLNETFKTFTASNHQLNLLLIFPDAELV